MKRLFRTLSFLIGTSTAWLIALLGLSLVLGFVGFFEVYRDSSTGTLTVSVWELLYRTVQLFFGELSLPEDYEPGSLADNLALQVARFTAMGTAIFAIVKALFPRFLHFTRVVWHYFSPKCVVLLGYGPIGQGIATGLRGFSDIRHITVIDPTVTPEMRARARADGVLLVEGDPGRTRLLDVANARTARRIYVTGEDDLIAIDRAVALRRYLGKQRSDVRVVLRDGAIGSEMPEAVGTGFLGATDCRWYALSTETARALIAEARIDRVAVERSQTRVHLAIFGCGRQGEAIAVEALLTAWRRGLGPPRITFLDRDPDCVRARMQRRMPVWFDEPDGEALPECARPELVFRACDLDRMDFGTDAALDGLRDDVSGWVFATGSDTLNLRASAALHRGIMAKDVSPAPIHVRIPSGHVTERRDISMLPLSLVQTFGAVDAVLAAAPLLRDDPDVMPRELHVAYEAARREMDLYETGEIEVDWADLPETRREANRAAFRLAAMRFEDMGSEATARVDHVPASAAGLSHAFLDADKDGTRSAWLVTDPSDLAGLSDAARLVREMAICEHNRWIVERALSGFRSSENRDDIRRLNPNLRAWDEIADPMIRRYDTVLLRALLSKAESDSPIVLRPARHRTIFLSVRRNGCVAEPKTWKETTSDGRDVTELRLHVNVAATKGDPDVWAETFLRHLEARHLDSARMHLPRRLRFDFTLRPSVLELATANALAVALQTRTKGALRINGHWAWSRDGPATVGFVGHRDLTGFGDPHALTERLQQQFMAAVACGFGRLVTGFAPGADQSAVKAWRDLGLPLPRLVFPFARKADGKAVYYSDTPDAASSDNTYRVADLVGLGRPDDAASGSHGAQAVTVLDASDLVIALVDAARPLKPGGTVDTVERAKSRGLEVIVVGPEPA